MIRNIGTGLFLSISIIILNLTLPNQVIGQTITGFSPIAITAGTESVLTINGSGFGTSGQNSTNYIQFSGASATEGVPFAKALEYVSWTDNQILVKVPSDAGTGTIMIINGSKTVTSASSLTVTYDIEDAVFNNIAHPLVLVNRNTYGGYTRQFSANFNDNTNATQALTRALKTWKCGTNVNWIIGNPTAVNVPANDGVNVITFDSDSDKLDAGVLGEGIYIYESANTAVGRWEIVDVDIIFANATEVNWNFGAGPPTSSQIDFESVALHELGHTLGLGHVNDNTDVMYAAFGFAEARRTLKSSDLNAGDYIMANSTATATQFAFPPMIAIGAGSCIIPAPIISSFTPTEGGAGTAVKIKGTSFTGALSVSFGGISASAFSVLADTLITAVVSTGSSGNINIVAPQGLATTTGFTFIPTPLILAGGPIAFIEGGNVVLTANTGAGYTYSWAKDGVDISGVTGPTYTASASGSYTVSIVAGPSRITSPAVVVVAQFTLPATNYKLAITSATCKGSANGDINISAVQILNYTATITGNGLNAALPFTGSVDIANLTAGTYSVCITVAGQSNYQECFSVVITQPQDLSVYSTINKSINSVDLALSGGAIYNILLNGTLYTTTSNTINLQLKQGNNEIAVTTDKLCQGTFLKTINISTDVIPYPDPFQNTLNLNLGNNNVTNVSVEIRTLSNGSIIYSKHYANQADVLELDVSTLKSGIYVLILSMDDKQKVFKIMKK